VTQAEAIRPQACVHSSHHQYTSQCTKGFAFFNKTCPWQAACKLALTG
jgi:hypothetical protein